MRDPRLDHAQPIAVPAREVGGTPHVTIGHARDELPVGQPRAVHRTRDPDGRQLTPTELEIRRALVRSIAADPVQQQWLRDYGAALLRSASAELMVNGWERAVQIVERRADEHERGETALW